MADTTPKTRKNRPPVRQSAPHARPQTGDFDESLAIYMRQISQMPKLSPDEIHRICGDMDKLAHEWRPLLLATAFAATELLRLIDRILTGESPDILLTPSALRAPELQPDCLPETMRQWQRDIRRSLQELTAAFQAGTDTRQPRAGLAAAVTRFDITGDLTGEWLTVLEEYLHLANWPKHAVPPADTGSEAFRLLCSKLAAGPAETVELVNAIRRLHQALERERARIIESNLQLVISVARHYRNRGIRFNDLIQEGNIGLMRALEKYDFRLGYRFNTYACWWIRQNIIRAIAKQSRTIQIPAHMLKTIEAMNRAEQRFIQEHDRTPETAELAAMLRLSEPKVSAIRRMAWQTISLQAPLAGNDDGSTWETILPDTGSDHLRELSRKTVFRQVYAMIQSLPEREQQILIRRFGLYGQPPQSLEAVSSYFGLTRERIRQLEIQLISKLRRTAGEKFFDGITPTD